MNNKREFFDIMAENWDKNEKVTPEKYRRIIDELKIVKGHKILDVGTGTGVLILYFLEKGIPVEIYAIDYSEKMVEKFREKKFPENVKSFVMDIHKTDFENEFFDRVVANACFPHFEDKEKALKEIYRILKKGGIFVISHPTGRKFVNELHRNTHPLIKNDIIPGIKKLKEFVENIGFKFIKGIDEKDFFLMSFEK